MEYAHVRNKRPSLVHLPGCTLKPGINKVKMDLLKTLQDNATISAWFDEKIGFLSLEDVDGDKGPKDAAPLLSLEGLRTKDAKAAIASETDVALIMHWADNEQRGPVKAACEARLLELHGS